jgi:hypothetical protein
MISVELKQLRELHNEIAANRGKGYATSVIGAAIDFIESLEKRNKELEEMAKAYEAVTQSHLALMEAAKILQQNNDELEAQLKQHEWISADRVRQMYVKHFALWEVHKKSGDNMSKKFHLGIIQSCTQLLEERGFEIPLPESKT